MTDDRTISQIISRDYELDIIRYIRHNPCCGRLQVMVGAMGKDPDERSESVLFAYDTHIRRCIARELIFDRKLTRGMTGSCLVLNRARLGVDYDPDWGKR